METKKLLRPLGNEILQEFKGHAANFYTTCIEYLEKWSAPLEEFNCFDWMKFKNIKEDTSFDVVSPCLEYLQSKNVEICEAKLIDQFYNLKVYVSKQNLEDETSLDQRWCNFFKANTNPDLHSELLKICQFFFAIPGHNGSVERVFSLVNTQWTKERNRLLPTTVRGILLTKWNLRHLECDAFYKYMMADTSGLLNKISSSEKYC